MFFDNYLIFIYLAIFVIVYNLVKVITDKLLWRNAVIFSANILILLTLIKEHTLIVLSVLSILVYIGGRVLSHKKTGTGLAGALTVILLLFTVRNYPAIQGLLTQVGADFVNAPILSVQKLGLSYILFRYVHWLIESYRGKIKGANWFSFINYIFFFPSILAGPIDTYTNFQYWLSHTRSTYNKALFFSGITRIFIGAVKTLAIVPLIINYATDYEVFLSDFSPFMALTLSLITYSAYIYIDFSGYSDIAIGTAYLIGIKTPENFNNPYISKNLSEFWKRWHITFSQFLGMYVFRPSLKIFNKIINPKHRLLVSILAYLFTFIICGLWHGSTINFVLWGLWHGVGLSINKIWTLRLKPILNIPNNAWYRRASIFITFMYVSYGWVFFHYDMDQLKDLYLLLW